jgi:hypothetical protein
MAESSNEALSLDASEEKQDNHATDPDRVILSDTTSPFEWINDVEICWRQFVFRTTKVQLLPLAKSVFGQHLERAKKNPTQLLTIHVSDAVFNHADAMFMFLSNLLDPCEDRNRVRSRDATWRDLSEPAKSKSGSAKGSAKVRAYASLPLEEHVHLVELADYFSIDERFPTARKWKRCLGSRFFARGELTNLLGLADRYPNISLFVLYAAQIIETLGSSEMKKLSVPASVQLPLLKRLANTLYIRKKSSGGKKSNCSVRKRGESEEEEEGEEEPEEEEEGEQEEEPEEY